jgi:hypothetical protein
VYINRKKLIHIFIVFIIFSFFIICGFKIFQYRQKNQLNACVCKLSEAVVPTIKLLIENDKPWASNSYHLIKWKKSCNLSTIRLKILDSNNQPLSDYKFSSCDSDFVYKIPELKQNKFSIHIYGQTNESSYLAEDKTTVDYIPGDNIIYNWKLLTSNAEFYERDGIMGAEINNNLYLFGGWNPSKKYHTNNEIWSSKSGVNWKFMGKAPWDKRHCAGRAYFKNRFWIIGGDCNQGFYNNDIWSTADGINWQKEIDSIPWKPRMNFGVRIYDNKIWLLGGERINYAIAEEKELFNDVWCSDDGKKWKRIADTAPWTPRGYLGSFCGAAEDKLIVIGGGEYGEPKLNLNDVWISLNGVNWTNVLKNAPWTGKRYPNFCFFDGKLWMMAGVQGNDNTKDVWYTIDLYNWYKVDNVPWQPRHAAALIAQKDGIIIAGGYLKNDVWKLEKQNNAGK